MRELGVSILLCDSTKEAEGERRTMVCYFSESYRTSSYSSLTSLTLLLLPIPRRNPIHNITPVNMVQWLQPLISVAVLVISFFSSHPNQSPQALISNATIDYIESIRLKYDVPGISIGIIASPTHTGHDWQNETHGFGHMNDQGRAVDGDVSLRPAKSEALSSPGKTLFVIASNSKLFAAVSIGLLIDNQTMLENGEKLDYCTKIKSILPNWHMEYPYLADHLDVLDLLCM